MLFPVTQNYYPSHHGLTLCLFTSLDGIQYSNRYANRVTLKLKNSSFTFHISFSRRLKVSKIKSEPVPVDSKALSSDTNTKELLTRPETLLLSFAHGICRTEIGSSRLVS